MSKIIPNFLAKASIFVFFALFSISSVAFSQEEQVQRNYSYLYGKKILYNEIFYKNDKKVRLKRYSPDGGLDLEVVYDRNEKELESKSYLKGVLYEGISYKDGEREHVRRYHPNGNLDTEVFYKDGEPDGTAKSYYDNGVLRAENEYKDGKRYLLRFYNEKGDLQTVSYFDEGVLPTKTEEYQNGKIIKTVKATRQDAKKVEIKFITPHDRDVVSAGKIPVSISIPSELDPTSIRVLGMMGGRVVPNTVNTTNTSTLNVLFSVPEDYPAGDMAILATGRDNEGTYVGLGQVTIKIEK